MKVKNKKTGKIAELGYIASSDGYIILQDVNTEEFIVKYNSLAELNSEWEDYEDPKEYWFVSCDGRALKATTDEDEYNERHNTGHKQIGNYFSSREEAERAVEKLKTWKRLKDKGISFEVKVIDSKWYLAGKDEQQYRTFDEAHDLYKDVMFIFGGEE